MLKRLGILLLLAAGCAPREPAPVRYGADVCHFCKMTILDNRFSASLLTAKGRTLAFDAVECLVNHLAQVVDPKPPAVIRVADFSRPGTMVPAGAACYLVSPALPSPMGEFLSAYGSTDSCRAVQARRGGETYSWEEIRARLAKP
jgi:copper chaperone NosL